MFLDDVEYQSFVRRLAWSPDGSFMLTPAACYYDLQNQSAPRGSYTYTVYGFLKNNLGQPSFMLPGLKTYATCVKFNPYLFLKQKPRIDKTTGEEIPAMVDLPHRVVFAVATTDQVLIYSTDSIVPIAIVSNIHYAPINDMAWQNSRKLIACSSDGYCSVISFA